MRLSLACLLLPLLLPAQIGLPTFELNHRIDLTVKRLTDLERSPAFTERFLLADVDLQPEDPRRFYNFSGDLSGRYIEVMSLVDENMRGSVGLDGLVQKVIAKQQEDGRFGDPKLRYTAEEIGGEHMALLWGNGRLLVGLMTYYEQTQDAAPLRAAERLADFFIGTVAESKKPETAERLKGFGAKGIICFTQYIEGLAMLARATGKERYVQAAKDAYEALPDRGEVHTHGYLTTLRGMLMLYEVTGEQRELDYVRQTFDALLASPDYTRHGAVYEYFGGHGDRDEGCSSADFVRLAFHLHRLTGEDRYLDVAEEGLYNALFYNQYPNGDFGHHFFAESGMLAGNPRRAWWCCTMHGLRALLAVQRQSLLIEKDGKSMLQLLVTQQYEDDRRAFSLRYGDSDELGQHYWLTVDRWDGSELHLRMPGGSQTKAQHLTVAAGDVVDFIVKYEAAFHPGTSRSEGKTLPEEPATGYLTYGPYLMGINQDDFVAEPDWGNQVSWRNLRSGNLPLTLTADYRHGGYPGEQEVLSVPVSFQTYYGHPYLRLTTEYSFGIVPKSAD